jgi:hypothetical protein
MDESREKSKLHVVQLQLQFATLLVPNLEQIFYLEVGMTIGIDDSEIARLVDLKAW